jgi:hypothetical protein
MNEQQIFEEAKIGYGFEEVEQTPEGLYCAGCLTTHKRPTKMYQTGSAPKELWCKHSIVHFWNPANI